MDLEQKTLTVSHSDRSERARYGMEMPTPPSTDDLSLSRERKKKPVNVFLSELHELGPVHAWKACFAARYRGSIVGVCLLSTPTSRYLDDGDTIELQRFCTRPDRPANTGSWLIAKARKWAALEGYDEMIAYAGIAGNRGVVYDGSGFVCVNGNDPGQGGGDGWTNRDGRTPIDVYEKRKWTYDLKGLR